MSPDSGKLRLLAAVTFIAYLAATAVYLPLTVLFGTLMVFGVISTLMDIVTHLLTGRRIWRDPLFKGFWVWLVNLQLFIILGDREYQPLPWIGVTLGDTA